MGQKKLSTCVHHPTVGVTSGRVPCLAAQSVEQVVGAEQVVHASEQRVRLARLASLRRLRLKGRLPSPLQPPSRAARCSFAHSHARHTQGATMDT